jgi:hypothetical protein
MCWNTYLLIRGDFDFPSLPNPLPPITHPRTAQDGSRGNIRILVVGEISQSQL